MDNTDDLRQQLHDKNADVMATISRILYGTEMCESLAKDVCDFLSIPFHHCDIFKNTRYEGVLSKAICVIYSEATGPWRAAINTDGSITLPCDPKMAAERFVRGVLGIQKPRTTQERILSKVKIGMPREDIEAALGLADDYGYTNRKQRKANSPCILKYDDIELHLDKDLCLALIYTERGGYPETLLKG